MSLRIIKNSYIEGQGWVLHFDAFDGTLDELYDELGPTQCLEAIEKANQSIDRYYERMGLNNPRRERGE